MNGAFDLAQAQALDAADPLAAKRAAFALPDGIIYLDGNSLGALPRAAAERVAKLIESEWGDGLIRSWNTHGWIDAPRRLGERIARLVGAGSDEVVVTDSTSVNLFKLLAAACAARPGRSTILTEPGNFPTDLYIASGVAATLPDRQVKTVPAEAIVEAIDDDVAVVMLTHVHYKSGRMFDMRAITAAAHARGALMLWDLSHSTGAVTVDLNGCGADLAVGCGYKYLNGGPGAPAFLYVARALQDGLRSPLTGWMGHGQPFAFSDAFEPAAGVARFLCGTPPIVAMAALEQGLATFDDIAMHDVIAKSRRLSECFIAAVEERCAGMGLALLSPRGPAERGSHVSFEHRDAYALCQALIARGVIGDYRAPEAIRFGFTPLYTSFEDIHRAVDILAAILAGDVWNDAQYRVRTAVT